MNYRSLADLGYDIKANLHKIPRDVSLVVGIPRSGLLAANLIAIYLNLPLTDIDSFINGRILSPNSGAAKKNEEAFNGKILVVDDSVATGKAIVDARKRLDGLLQNKTVQILFCCVYAEPSRKHMVDVALTLLERPRLFEWNLFHNSILTKSCVEIDGVLCEAYGGDPHDETAYENHLRQVQPYFIPKSKIACLVTARPIQYKSLTEAWLRENNIQYDALWMYDSREMKAPSYFKAKKYKDQPGMELFLEGNARQAAKIFELTGKDVFCLEENKMHSRLTYKKLTLQMKRKSLFLLRNIRESVFK